MFTGEKELDVIHVAVVVNVKFTENDAKGEEISDEEKGPQDTVLGHTCIHWGGVRFEGFKLGVEPVKGGVSDPNGGVF